MPNSSTCKRNQITAPGLMRKVCAGWLAVAAVEYWCLPGPLRDLANLDGLARMSFFRVMIATCLAVAFLSGLSLIADTRKVEKGLIALSLGALMLGALIASFTWPLLVGCLLLGACVAVYILRGWNGTVLRKVRPRKSRKRFLLVIGIAAAAFCLFVGTWLFCRVRTFSTPTYDFGIFAQMFHNMRTTGLPMTTVERDGLLSHFAVHVSPIYYLMLPVYWIFPFPETLQLLQAAILALAVIPMWKLGKHHGLTDWQNLLLCVLLLLYPALSGGTSYDLHENCFLVPLVLWLFYGLDRKHTGIIAVSAILTLCVKEDAAVYVAVIGLWVSLSTLLKAGKKDRYRLISGAVLLVVALGWFLAVTSYLANHGDGVMTYRYKNFMYDGSGSLTTVIKAVVMNPMKAFYECLDKEKLPFIALTLLPLLGLPLITRRYERYLLLIPYLLVNLMTDYKYQYDVFFQYVYGPMAFLFYLTLVNLADLKLKQLHFPVLCAAVLAAAISFGTTVYPKAIPYPKLAIRYSERNTQIRQTLDTIPANASVAANTFYTTYLSQREVLYDLSYCSAEHFLESEYVVIRLSNQADIQRFYPKGVDPDAVDLKEFMTEQGYEIYTVYDGILEIYHKK